MSHDLSYLYDVPGPRTRRRVRLASVASLLALGGLLGLALWQFGAHGQLAPERWRPLVEADILRYLLVGLVAALGAAAVVSVLAFPLGVVLAVARSSDRRAARLPAVVFIEVFRTVPVLLLIYVMLFALPKYGLNPDVLWKLAIPLTIANAAAIAEIVRAGILSLPRGQVEAGLSLGLRPLQVTRIVVLPQALKRVTPSLVSQLVSLLKDTSLGYVVAFTELLYRAQVLTSYNRLLIQTYLVVALIYLVTNGALSAFASRLRRRAPVPDPAALPEAGDEPVLQVADVEPDTAGVRG